MNHAGMIESSEFPCITPPLAAEDVSVEFDGVRVLNQVTFSAGPACLMGVVGPNGAGKSTLFNVISGLLAPHEGRVLVNGRSIDDARGELAYVPQSEKVNWRLPMSVYNLTMLGRTRNIGWLRRPGRDDRNAVRDALEQVGMWDRRDSQVGELSGGQRQRVFVARALAQNADILLLDEAFSGVDPASQETLVSLLHELRDDGKTILLSSHDLEHVAHYCDECLCINNHVCACGAPADVLTEDVMLELYGPYGARPVHGSTDKDGHHHD